MNIVSQKLKILKNDKSARKQPEVVFVSQNTTHSINELPSVSPNKYLINFTGLNRNLSKMAYKSAESIKAEVENFSKSKGIVGNLPSEWVQRIPKENREKVIKELYQDLKTVVKGFNADSNTDNIVGLNDALRKAGVIRNDENAELKRLGDGIYGVGYHLKGIFDDKYMIKIFKSKRNYNDLHGKYAELNRAAYLQKYAGKDTQMVPFYFGDADAGYMVNKYIDKNAPECKKQINTENYGLVSCDVQDNGNGAGHNIIKGFQIDYGGIKVINESLVKNKSKQSTIKKILAMPVEKQLNSLSQADSTVKNFFVSQLKYMPANKRAVYFTQLAQNANDKVKIGLVDKIYFLSKDDKIKGFTQLAQNAGDKVKIELANIIYCLPNEHKKEGFMQLLESGNVDVKTALAENLSSLPAEERLFCFEQLAKGADKELKAKLKDNICNLPRLKRRVAEKALLNNEDQKGLWDKIGDFVTSVKNESRKYII